MPMKNNYDPSSGDKIEINSPPKFGAYAGNNAAYEAIIRRHPEQYMWGQRRFRHSPDLDRDPYAP